MFKGIIIIAGILVAIYVACLIISDFFGKHK